MTRSPRLAAHLLWRIHRRYPTVSESLDFGAVKLKFVRIADPDRVLDDVAAEEDRREKFGAAADATTLSLPYWAELWESALALALSMCQAGAQHFLAPTSNVMDLGCGMGLAGCVAARLGANVLFADLEPLALLFARLNSLPDFARVRTRRLNWQTDRLTETFDLILGADILYERAQWPFLEPFWRAHLAAGGMVLLGEPGRQTGDEFVDWIRQRGWTLTTHPETVRGRNMRIFELTPALQE
jgi:predicted nicotinamide N-methyase